MPNILTPITLCNSFDVSLPVNPVVLSVETRDGVKIERLNFQGRDTGDGRVQIAAAYAYDPNSTVTGTGLILPDSRDTLDDEVLSLFVKRGYSALMVDYRGEWEGCTHYTVYPPNVEYANLTKCGRRKDYVDDSADKTSWYEWISVGLYARKYIALRTGSDNIAAVGIRDGGEIAWKLAVAGNFSCIIPVCAAGWKAYSGLSKYLSDEPKLDEERYRFIAGIDSQAYAPYVKCPVLLLCSTNDARFDYDRAYDTFSRINAEFEKDSVISYSVRSNAGVGTKSVADLFLFLDKNLKNRQVFMPKPATVTVEVDEEDNLVARTVFDNQGVVESCGVYLAEDNVNSVEREWVACPKKREISINSREYYLNIYEKTTVVFVFCYVTYSNGFTVWSKMAVKKLNGKFRNMQSRSHVMYSSENGVDGFAAASPETTATGGIFFADDAKLPRLVKKAKGICGLYAEGGLRTYRMNTPRYSPSAGNILSVDLFCDGDSEVTLTLTDIPTGEEYSAVVSVIGGVWQSFIFENNLFKNAGGVSLPDFTGETVFTVNCPEQFAINNVIWL